MIAELAGKSSATVLSIAAAAVVTVSAPIYVEVPSLLRDELKAFEPSAVLYIADSNRYLVASDETTESNRAWLFLMDDGGHVDKKSLAIGRLRKMTDIESLSRDADGFIYVMSSQSLNKHGEEKRERNLFVKSELVGGSVSELKTVELRPLLIESILSFTDPLLVGLQVEVEDALDVESHFLMNGELYVGLKEPMVSPSVAVILNLGPIDNVLSGKVEATLWRTLDLRARGGVTNRLSDLAWVDGELFATTTSYEGEGRLWNVTAAPQLLTEFDDLHPEGVSTNDEGGLAVAFDDSDESDGLLVHLERKSVFSR